MVMADLEVLDLSNNAIEVGHGSCHVAAATQSKLSYMMTDSASMIIGRANGTPQQHAFQSLMLHMLSDY